MIVDLLPDPPESYVVNCLIRCKPDDDDSSWTEALFVLRDGIVTARLNGYAITPRDEYENMVQELFEFRNQDKIA